MDVPVVLLNFVADLLWVSAVVGPHVRRIFGRHTWLRRVFGWHPELQGCKAVPLLIAMWLVLAGLLAWGVILGDWRPTEPLLLLITSISLWVAYRTPPAAS
jgi:hypothetical protein